MGTQAPDQTDDIGTAVGDLQRRYRQQAAVVVLSQAAIGSHDVDALWSQTVALVASTLATEVVAIGEFLGDGTTIRIAAGIGTIERPAGTAVDTTGTTFARLRDHSPLVSGQIDEAADVAWLRQLTASPIKSYLAARVMRHDRPWGFILAASSRARTFAADESEFVGALAHVLRLVAEHHARDRVALAELEGRFVNIFQNSPVALGLSTIEHGRILDVNERWLALFGFRRDEVIGRTNVELGLTIDHPRRAALADRARTEGVVRDVEMQVRSKSGAVFDVIVSAVPLDTASGERSWMSAVVDITDRKCAEAERDQLLAREQIARAEAEQALEKLDAVYTIADSVPGETGLGELLGEVLRRIRRTLQVDHASVLLLEDEGKALYLRAMDGELPQSGFPQVRVPLGVGMSGRIAAEGRPMIVNDYSSVDLTGVEGTTNEIVHRTTKSMMGAPFRVGGQVAGVVVATSVQPRQFTSEELKLLTLAADRVAPAIERGRLIAKIRSGLERQRMLSQRLLTAQEEERRRLAVELHDELGQVLTAVKINLESVERTHGVSLAPTAMAGMIRSIDESLQRVRDIALDLRPSVLDDLGLSAAMRWYADRFSRAARVEAHLSIGPLPEIDPGVMTACFRVAQEALTNVGRHARADHVWIDLHVLAGALELNIRDDGIGFDVPAARERAIRGASIGLLGMQERVALMGGEYEIVKVTAGGTEVRARFPLPERPS